MSTDPSKTGLVALTWDGFHPAAIEEYNNPKRSDIVRLIRESAARSPRDSWAVDVPFGWPQEFVRWLSQHHPPVGNPPAPVAPGASSDLDGRSWDRLARRETDRAALKRIGSKASGYSVSFDKLGATAAAWASIDAALATGEPRVRIDRSGRDGFVLETWPSAAWTVLGELSGFKARNPATMAPDEFASILEGVVDLSGQLLTLRPTEKGAHFRDAVVCALVARAMQVNRRATVELPDAANTEGWIHLPEVDLHALPTKGR
jgi:hypothetical protein